MVKQNKFHYEDPHLFVATAHNVVARATWRPWIVRWRSMRCIDFLL